MGVCQQQGDYKQLADECTELKSANAYLQARLGFAKAFLKKYTTSKSANVRLEEKLSIAKAFLDLIAEGCDVDGRPLTREDMQTKAYAALDEIGDD